VGPSKALRALSAPTIQTLCLIIMNRNYELKVLRQVSKLMKSEDNHPVSSAIFKVVLYVLALVAIVGSYVLVGRELLSGQWGVVIAAFGGTFIGVASYFGIAMKQWPAIRPHIDKESLEHRINEIKT